MSNSEVKAAEQFAAFVRPTRSSDESTWQANEKEAALAVARAVEAYWKAKEELEETER